MDSRLSRVHARARGMCQWNLDKWDNKHEEHGHACGCTSTAAINTEKSSLNQARIYNLSANSVFFKKIVNHQTLSYLLYGMATVFT